ncbi:MAG: hypothetical protein MO846_08890 [Candidatus Devosia symbiotica]|nr:hypothetical protein [Candidatus Devosia symbiotica]
MHDWAFLREEMMLKSTCEHNHVHTHIGLTATQQPGNLSHISLKIYRGAQAERILAGVKAIYYRANGGDENEKDPDDGWWPKSPCRRI